MKKNKRIVIIIPIVLLTIISIVTVFKKDTNIVEKSKVSKIERKEFSIYLQKTVGSDTYDPSADTAFPTNGYLLNTTKTVCKGYNDQEIKPAPVVQELTNDVINGSITINSKNTIYCDLYFDKNETPTISKFDITGKTSNNQNLTNGFTYQTDNIPFTVTYTDNESDVKQYCINETNSIENCNWQTLSETNSYSLKDNKDGEKTMYIYLKDKANNISSGKSAAITVDQTKPVVKTFNLIGTADTSQTLSSSTEYTHKVGITYNASITENNIDSYCVYESSCSYTSLTSTTIKNQNYTLNDTEGSHTVNIRVKDKAGNESDVSTQSITLDKSNPTATISQNSVTTESITVTVGYQEPDSIIKRQCKLDSEDNWTDANPDGSCTLSNLSDGTQYTIQARVRDASGRWNTTYPSVTVTTEKAGFSGTGKQLIEYNPKGLSSEPDCQGTMRFVGRCDAKNNGCDGIVDNFVCFGYGDESECRVDGESNEYLYRIIGVTSKGEMKLIKNKIFYDVHKWDYKSKGKIEMPWSESNLNGELNGSDFLTSLSQGWQLKIIKHSWPDGYMPYDVMISTSHLQCETEDSLSQSESKIGLMSVSDFTFAFGGGETICINGIHTCEDGWLNKYQGKTLLSSYNIYTTIRYPSRGTAGYDQGIWIYPKMGAFTTSELIYSGYVRPVFFLSPSTSISSGRGTSTDPFIVDAGGCSGSGTEMCVE